MESPNSTSKPMSANAPQANSPVSGSQASSSSVAAMRIQPNHKTYVSIDKALSKFGPAVAKILYQFHGQISVWQASTLADIQCEAHVRGVTYMVRNGDKAFVWIDFIANGLSIMVPFVDPAAYPGSKRTTNTPDNVPGARVKVTEPAHIPLAVRAIQDAYKARI